MFETALALARSSYEPSRGAKKGEWAGVLVECFMSCAVCCFVCFVLCAVCYVSCVVCFAQCVVYCMLCVCIACICRVRFLKVCGVQCVEAWSVKGVFFCFVLHVVCFVLSRVGLASQCVPSASYPFPPPPPPPPRLPFPPQACATPPERPAGTSAARARRLR